MARSTHTRDLHALVARAGFPSGCRVLVGVSGGVDSVALLRLLHDVRDRLHLKLAVAHVHHGIRGRDADADRDFVASLARELTIPFHGVRRNVPALAHKKGLSIEMAAREARYAAFRRLMRSASCDVLALGHTADEQAETLLLRLLRGTSPAGLGAMETCAAHSGLVIMRPLLTARKATLKHYLEDRGLAWREDGSNTDPGMLRNRLRLEVIPLLEERFNPKWVEAFSRLADLAREDSAWIRSLARVAMEEAGDGSGLSCAALLQHPRALQRHMLLCWIEGRGGTLDFGAMDRLLRLAQGGRGTQWVPLPGGGRVVRRYDRLVWEREQQASSSRPGGLHKLAMNGETVLSDWGLVAGVDRSEEIHKPRAVRIGDYPACATISRRAVGRAGLYVRAWREGDRMLPLGMQGSRKVQDVFVDGKVSRDRRSRIPLLVCRGQIVWIPGYRVAQGWEARTDEAPHVRVRLDTLSK